MASDIKMVRRSYTRAFSILCDDLVTLCHTEGACPFRGAGKCPLGSKKCESICKKDWQELYLNRSKYV